MRLPLITIRNRTGSRVEYRHPLAGRVFPPDSRVQVLVHAADGEWYVQQDAVQTDNGKWSIDAVFGCPEGPLHDFEAVAVIAPEKITVRHLPDVPADLVSSRRVRLVRVK